MKFELAQAAMQAMHTEMVNRNFSIPVLVDDVTDLYVYFSVGYFELSTKDGKLWDLSKKLQKMRATLNDSPVALHDLELGVALDHISLLTKNEV